MAYPIIDSQTETHNWVIEKCSVRLDLLELNAPNGKFGVNYSAHWSGVKKGQISGGPVPVPGNGSTVVNHNPDVTVIVSNYNDTGSTVSMHVKVTVAAGGPIGTKTVFDKTLSGAYPAATFSDLVASLQADHAPATVPA